MGKVPDLGAGADFTGLVDEAGGVGEEGDHDYII
jgi:hypothetical protein